MIDGRTLSGRLAHFSPYAPDLTIEIDEEEEGTEAVRSRRALLRGEQVAYVAFRTVLSGPASQRNERATTRVKIHLVGDRTIVAQTAATDGANPLGFYAYPVGSEWDVVEYFFYSHGVRRKEIDEPIGQMLVNDGVVEPEQVERGLEVQREQRQKSLADILVDHNKITPERLDEAMSLRKRRKVNLGDLLIEAGVASQADIDAAQQEQQRNRGKRVGEVLLEMKIVSEEDLMRTLARKFSLPFVDLDEHPIQWHTAKQVPRTLIENLGVVPIYSDSQNIIIAISDPLAFQAGDLLKNLVHKRVVEVLVAPSQLRKYIEQYLGSLESTGAKLPEEVDAILEDLSRDDLPPPVVDEPAEDQIANSDSAVVRLVNRIIIDGYQRRASDIHIEPNGRERDTLVRFRIDGDCVRYHSIPSSFRNAVVARIKIMANLDISERRKPQDGKIRFKLGEKIIELRVATLPTVNDNEDVVMRILASSKPIPLEKMGLSARNLKELTSAIERPYGLVLCVGPTGSGKTTTLHSALSVINTMDRKIWTAEDPVEITQQGLRQVQVQPKVGYTFDAAMRAFLRADPDVIMVGEMRDLETAGTAVEASLTGHLVLSTLHTNSAPETITRLLDMGLDPFSFADALLVVLAQRLARALCPSCKQRTPVSRVEYDEIVEAYGAEAYQKNIGIPFGPEFTVCRPKGCPACDNLGYRGRVAVHELLVATDELRKAIAKKAPVATIRDLATQGGMTTLIQDGIDKLLLGQTDLTQVIAVCGK